MSIRYKEFTSHKRRKGICMKIGNIEYAFLTTKREHIARSNLDNLRDLHIEAILGPPLDILTFLNENRIIEINDKSLKGIYVTIEKFDYMLDHFGRLI